MEIEKDMQTGILLSLYGCLLTQRQFDIMSLYFDEDLSLAEVAEQYGISRQAVHDQIKRGIISLKKYENKLGLSELQQLRHSKLVALRAKAQAALDDPDNAGKILKELINDLDADLNDYDNSDYI